MQADMSSPYGHIDNGLLAVKQGKIAWLGHQQDAPKFNTTQTIDGQGGWLTPGLIDCHTHLVYGGNRAEEFEWHCQGQSYQQIAQQGGGILSTVAATRNATEAELLSSAQARLQKLLTEGVTTVEIKSGYGLDLETELRLLRVAKNLQTKLPVTIKTTFLGAHALPPEYQGQANQYIDYVCQQVLPVVAQQKLADAVDVFCETIGFNISQTKKVFTAAQRLGLNVKGHVEQLSYMGGAWLVADFHGLSVDHLEYLPEQDLAYLKQQKTVAVLLPAAFYFLQEKQKPPITAMRKIGLLMAVATDLNPGSAPMASLLLAMNQSCILFGLTPAEALTGVTRNAARALGISRDKGQLQVGYDADMVLWPIDHPAELSYGVNLVSPQQIWVRGRCTKQPI